MNTPEQNIASSTAVTLDLRNLPSGIVAMLDTDHEVYFSDGSRLTDFTLLRNYLEDLAGSTDIAVAELRASGHTVREAYDELAQANYQSGAEYRSLSAKLDALESVGISYLLTYPNEGLWESLDRQESHIIKSLRDAELFELGEKFAQEGKRVAIVIPTSLQNGPAINEDGDATRYMRHGLAKVARDKFAEKVNLEERLGIYGPSGPRELTKIEMQMFEAKDAQLAKALHLGIQKGFGYDVPSYRVAAIIARSKHVDERKLSNRIRVALSDNFAVWDNQEFEKVGVAIATMNTYLGRPNAGPKSTRENRSGKLDIDQVNVSNIQTNDRVTHSANVNNGEESSKENPLYRELSPNGAESGGPVGNSSASRMSRAAQALREVGRDLAATIDEDLTKAKLSPFGMKITGVAIEAGVVATAVASYVEELGTDLVDIAKAGAGVVASLPAFAKTLVRQSVERPSEQFRAPDAAVFDDLTKHDGWSMKACDSNTNGRQYTGNVIAVSDSHIYQNVGRGCFVKHDLSLFDSIPVGGKPQTQHTITYVNGRGAISSPDRGDRDIAADHAVDR